MLDRHAELRLAFPALDATLPIEVSGESGVGKTAVLRHLAHHPRSALFPDGCVYLEARHQSSGDLLQLIFEAFFENDEICKPTDAEMRVSLQEKQALILLDDVELASHELEQIIDTAPRSAFVVATRQRCLWGEVCALALHGLPEEDAASLLEREIERPLDAVERTAAANLCAGLGGHPLRILQAAALVRELGMSLEECGTLTPHRLLGKSIASIDDKQRRALLALTALPGVPLLPQDIAGIAEVIDIEPSLMGLVRRGLVINSQSRHRLADGVGDQLRRTDDLKPWVHRAITYFTAYAERHRRNAIILLEESEVLLKAQQCAADTRRWGEAMRLGRLLEGALVLGARWGAWQIALERCLAAAKATGDRSTEAWALHEMGARSVCLGESGTARALLRQALTLREALNEEDAAANSRQNLGFVVAPVSDDSRHRAATWPDAALDLDSLPLRDQTPPAIPVRQATRVSAVILTVVLLALVGGSVALWSAPEGLLASFSTGSLGALFHSRPRGPVTSGSTMARPLADAAASREVESADSERTSPEPETPLEDPGAAQALAADHPVIRIFSQRPDSGAARGPTRLCYAISGALRARVEPGIGNVTPTSTLTCLRVAPPRTTTYELIADGHDGDRVSQQLVVIVR